MMTNNFFHLSLAKIKLWKISLFVVIVFLIPISGHSQGVVFKDAQGWEFGAQVGTFLPFGIEGVRDQYPWWGAFLSHPGRIFSAYEWQFYHSRSKGVIFYQGSLSGRIDYQAYESMDGFFKIGVDTNYYQRKRTVLREFDFTSVVGGHVGFGTVINISNSLNFRAEFKFNFNPGTSLYVGGGLSYAFGGGDQNANPPN